MIIKDIVTHLAGDKYLCTRFHGNPFSSCYISLDQSGLTVSQSATLVQIDVANG